MTKIALVSCVKSAGTIHPSRQLYQNRLFEGMRQYAQTHSDKWFILSAEHGLLEPSQLVEPYEKSLSQMKRKERVKWALTVLDQLHQHVQPGDHVIFLAGRPYREFLVHPLLEYGCTVEVPLQGVEVNQQLSFLRKVD